MANKDWKEMFDSIRKKERKPFVHFPLDDDVNSLNEYGRTMLSYAAEWGNLEITELLVQQGADVNVTNIDGAKPLHVAAHFGHADIVKFFLNKGVSANSCDNNQGTSLHYIAQYDLSSVNRNSYSEIFRLLVDSKADLNAVNGKSLTPLLIAAQNRQKYTVELFIKLGANVKCCDERQWTVLHYSSWNGWSVLVQSLVEERFDIDLNAKESDDYTPLLLAAKNSHRLIVELLIKSGANVNCYDRCRYTVLHYSCLKGWFDIVKYLVKAECDLNIRDYEGNTPLLLAADCRHRSIVEYLIESGAKLGVCDNEGVTVLHYVCRQEWLNVVKYLIERGGLDVNVCDIYCDTPLYFAIFAPKPKIISYLLETGADCNLKNRYGATAFIRCIQGLKREHCQINLEIFMLFIENGAYFHPDDCNEIINSPLLKSVILQDVNVCTQAVINQFNNAELPKIYQIPLVVKKLPSIEKLKISSKGNIVYDIAKSANYIIQTKGYFNLWNEHPIVLSFLCVKSLVEYYGKH